MAKIRTKRTVDFECDYDISVRLVVAKCQIVYLSLPLVISFLIVVCTCPNLTAVN